MTKTEDSKNPPSRARRFLKRLAVGVAVAVAIGVALPFGCVGNRIFNSDPADYLRTSEDSTGLSYSVAVVEFDDMGQPWDLRQFEAALAEIRRLNRESEDGIILYQFVHGWKANADRSQSSGQRLAWFEDRIAAIAERSVALEKMGAGRARPVMGLYIGWRGRTYSLPVLIDASFWNRRVAAHRVASERLNEVLLRTANVAKENPDSKCALVGHSMGGMIVEKTLGPAIVAEVMTVEGGARSIPIRYDLVVSANPSTEALHTIQLVDILKRTSVDLVFEDDDGRFTPAEGPILVSITSEADGVTRFMVPFAMTVNSIFVRYRQSVPQGAPSQRELGVRTAGHVPFLYSHEVTVEENRVVLREKPNRWNDTRFWVFQVPAAVSADHSDIDGPLWGELMLQLMEANRVFDSNVTLRLADR